jgi:arylsulfatase A
MKKKKGFNFLAVLIFCCYNIAFCQVPSDHQAVQKPNIIFINADDLGYGDLSCYGATKINTPNIDKLAKNGLRFTNAHTTSATCTPSRYAMMTGQYPWRKNGTGILPGDAALIINPTQLTIASLLKRAGYNTGIVGKWHLGLGNEVEKNWNEEVKPGPLEVGFNYSFIFPATADRVPTVFLENHNVVATDSTDPILVSYKQKVGDDPTGKEHPELLKMRSSHGHDQTIVNGIGRIGYMSGGKKARWTDEELSLTFLSKAKSFIQENKAQPFFLYFALTEPHVPRMPATIFKGKSGLGYRGDAILQLDWTVGEIVKQLQYAGIEKNTIIIFSSDNGPVLDDGYMDDAVTKQNGHLPAGKLRGGKYSAFEGGTNVPFIVHWPHHVKPGVSNALICQVDFLASFAQLTKQPLTENDAPDSFGNWDAITGRSSKGRTSFVEQGGALAIIKDQWKYIEPNDGPLLLTEVNIESGNDSKAQLYDLENDPGEKQNVASKYPDIVKELSSALQKIKTEGKSRITATTN